MNIRINGVPISFKLENESTAGEVYDGVAAWLHAAGHRLESVQLNQETIVDAEGSWRGTAVADVIDLDIAAKSLREQQVNDFETIIHYAELLQRVLREGTSDQRDAVLEELPNVATGIRRTAPDLAGLLEEPLTGTDLHDDGVRERAGQRAGEMIVLLEGRQRELLDPEHEMRTTLSALDTILPTFEEIPGEIQGGERRRAMEVVARFSELVARELRILPLLMEIIPDIQKEEIEGIALPESIPALNELFTELEGALTNGDFVLIGDLLEYEMLPRFTALHTALRRHLPAPETTAPRD